MNELTTLVELDLVIDGCWGNLTVRVDSLAVTLEAVSGVNLFEDLTWAGLQLAAGHPGPIEFWLDLEPGEFRWQLSLHSELVSPDPAVSIKGPIVFSPLALQIQIAEMHDANQMPIETGRQLFFAECDPDAFAQAVVALSDRTLARYNEEILGSFLVLDFPKRALAALRGALSEPRPPPRSYEHHVLTDHGSYSIIVPDAD